MWPWDKPRAQVVQEALPPLKRLRGIWSQRGRAVTDLSKKQVLASSGTKLQDLMKHPGWQEVLDAKAFYQQAALQKSINLGTDDKARFQAAVEWSALQAFFLELTNRIAKGKEAQAELHALTQ